MNIICLESIKLIRYEMDKVEFLGIEDYLIAWEDFRAVERFVDGILMRLAHEL